jgi:hypothetical protein
MTEHISNLSLTKPLEARSSTGSDDSALHIDGSLQATLQLLADRAHHLTGGSGAVIGLLLDGKMICQAAAGQSATAVGQSIVAEPDSSLSTLAVPIRHRSAVVGRFEVVADGAVAFGEKEQSELKRLASMVEVALSESENYPPVVVPKAVEVPATHRVTPTDTVSPVAISPQELAAPPIVRGRIPLPRANDEESAAESLTGESSGARTSIRTCAGCGFPVSEERMICFDCEAAGLSVRNQSGLSFSSEGPTDKKNGWRKHLYTAGTITMAVATGVVLWLWLK